LEKANVLVTGGAGFIGSHLVEALLAAGYRVRVLDALVSQVHGENARPLYLDSGAEFIQADVCDRAAVDAALDGIDIVFHEAAEVGVGQSMYEIQRYVRANDYGTSVLLESIVERRPQIKKLVVASSMSIYGEGAYSCSTCGDVYPQLRPTSQLLDRRWDVECPTCGKPLAPKGTPKRSRCFQRRSTPLQNRTRNSFV
jgi:dTDP-L-rhamnose 4-epimerase